MTNNVTRTALTDAPDLIHELSRKISALKAENELLKAAAKGANWNTASVENWRIRHRAAIEAAKK